jgi:hypothetical protein
MAASRGTSRQNCGVINLPVVLRASVSLVSARDGLLHAIINRFYGVTRNDGTGPSLFYSEQEKDIEERQNRDRKFHNERTRLVKLVDHDIV